MDEAKYLQLAESLAGFRSKLRSRADTLDTAARQQILRLVVKEILVGTDTITLFHSDSVAGVRFKRAVQSAPWCHRIKLATKLPFAFGES